MKRIVAWLGTALWILASSAGAGEVHVAVAANFSEAAAELKQEFEARTGNKVLLSTGSTGQLYAQIREGAPFQVFLAADNERPAQAIKDGLAVAGTDFTYAVGTLVLYSAKHPELIDGAKTLRADHFDKLAIAEPALAPYGLAAKQAMEKLGVYKQLEPKLVMGRSIAQTMQFVISGNAEVGFVALSQVIVNQPGKYWVVPPDLYDPIRQDAVLLNTGKDNVAAREFLDYLRSAEAVAIIKKYGYGMSAPM